VDDRSSAPFDPREILIALSRARVDFVVVGGIAVQAYGHSRATRDLDVIPKPDLLNLSRLGEALAELEARPLGSSATINVTDPQLLLRVPMAPLLTKYGRLDVLGLKRTAGAPPSYEALREAAVEAEIGGHAVLVAGLDHLIRMKRMAGRDEDLEDVGFLTRDRSQLEREAGEST
jgi:predicted nucleotidyltransferase